MLVQERGPHFLTPTHLVFCCVRSLGPRVMLHSTGCVRRTDSSLESFGTHPIETINEMIVYLLTLGSSFWGKAHVNAAPIHSL